MEKLEEEQKIIQNNEVKFKLQQDPDLQFSNPAICTYAKKLEQLYDFEETLLKNDKTMKENRTQPCGRVLLSDASQLGLRLPDSSIGTTSQWLRLPGQFRQECEHVWLAGFSPDDDPGLEQQCRSLKSLSRFYRTYATIHRVSC